jgi:hypothetical protein
LGKGEYTFWVAWRIGEGSKGREAVRRIEVREEGNTGW